MPKDSAFGGREHIPLPHPPPMASKAGPAQLHRGLLLLHLTEHPPRENPGYTLAFNVDTWILHHFLWNDCM